MMIRFAVVPAEQDRTYSNVNIVAILRKWGHNACNRNLSCTCCKHYPTRKQLNVIDIIARDDILS
jgi:hypothetical protein